MKATEKKTLTIELEGDEIKDFKALIKYSADQTAGFNSAKLTKDQSDLGKKLMEELK